MTSYLAACCCEGDDDGGGGDGGDGIPGCCETNPAIVTVSVDLLAKANGTVTKYKINQDPCPAGKPFLQTTQISQSLRFQGSVTWDLTTGQPPVSNVIATASHICECNFEGRCAAGDPGPGCTLTLRKEASVSLPVSVGLSIQDFTDFENPFSDCDEQFDTLEGCGFLLTFGTPPGLMPGFYNAQTDCATWLNYNDEQGEWFGQLLGVQRQMIFKINNTPSGCELGSLAGDYDPGAWGCGINSGVVGHALAAYGGSISLGGDCVQRSLRGEEIENFIDDYGFNPCTEEPGTSRPCYNGGSFTTRMSDQSVSPDGSLNGFITAGTLEQTNQTTMEWN